VRVSFDVKCFADHIKNLKVQDEACAIDELECLGKFYMPENGGVHTEPMVVVDRLGQILLWYLPEVLSLARLVRCKSP